MTLQSALSRACRDLFTTTALANLVAAFAVTGAIALNVAHTLATNQAAGIAPAIAMGAVFGAIALGGPVAAHMLPRVTGSGRITCALAVLISLCVCTIVGISAQSSGRSASAAARTGTSEHVAALKAQRTRATVELDALQPGQMASRSSPELAALIAETKARPNCKPACNASRALEVELARADRRVELVQTIAQADKKLETLPRTEADPQAATIVWLLSMAGITADPANVGRALSVFMAASIELFAVVAAGVAGLSGRSPVPAQSAPNIVGWRATNASQTTTPGKPIKAQPIKSVAAAAATRSVQPISKQTQPNTPSANANTSADQKLLQALSVGDLVGTRRVIAAQIGLPLSTMQDALTKLAASGHVRLGSGVVALT